MKRLAEKNYQQRLMLAMTGYLIAMMLLWPLVRSTDAVALKVLLALVPVVPMLYVVVLMAQRVRHSDELQQRTHLVALGLATAVVGALSLVGGFLAAAQLLTLDGSVLIFVFPALLAVYGAARWWLARGYGAGAACAEDGIARRWRLALVAAMMAAIALFAHWRDGDDGVWITGGLAVAFALAALIDGWRHRWRRDRSGAGHE